LPLAILYIIVEDEWNEEVMRMRGGVGAAYYRTRTRREAIEVGRRVSEREDRERD
jgi:hypothetical protein